MLPLLLGQLVAESPTKREPPLRFGPCEIYDISELSDHFQVEVSQQPAELEADKVRFTLSIAKTTAADDSRRPFPIRDLELRLRDEKGEMLLTTPLRWRSAKNFLSSQEEQAASFTISPEVAKRVSLGPNPSDFASFLDEPRIIVTFRSLEKK
jgi:hypothetical protein